MASAQASWNLDFHASLEIFALAGVLKDAAGNGYPDGDEDQAADQLAPLAGLGAEPVPEFQPGQGQDDADGTNDNRGGGEVDVVGTQGKADREIVDAQRNPGDQQPPGAWLVIFGRCCMLAFGLPSNSHLLAMPGGLPRQTTRRCPGR